jgi:hypothetical protein
MSEKMDKLRAKVALRASKARILEDPIMMQTLHFEFDEDTVCEGDIYLHDTVLISVKGYDLLNRPEQIKEYIVQELAPMVINNEEVK